MFHTWNKCYFLFHFYLAHTNVIEGLVSEKNCTLNASDM